MSSYTDTDTATSVIDIRKNKLRSSLLVELYHSDRTSINKLARLFHASIPSATGIVNELMKEGWIVETGIGPARAGRPPVLYGLNSQKYRTLIMDINRHDTRLVIMDLNNQTLYQHHVDIKLTDDNTFIDNLLEATDKFLEKHTVRPQELWGIGISMPGLINVQQGINQTYLSLTKPGVSITTLIGNHFKRPAILINDTHATTIGEHKFGSAQKFSHALTVNIDWGVGLGILLNGEVFSGSQGFAGELGHIQVRPDGILCYCGKVGCLDTITSAFALIRYAKEGIENGRATILSKSVEGNYDLLDSNHIIEAANAGDEFSIDLLYQLGTELGKGLATAVHLFNPEMIVVSGVLASAGTYITNPLEQAINKYCLSDFKNRLKLKISNLGSKARLLGTQAHLFESLAHREFTS